MEAWSVIDIPGVIPEMLGVKTWLWLLTPPAAVLIMDKVPWWSFLVEMSLLVAL